MTTYLLLGGGTAGHVNPLLAIAERIRDEEPDAEIIAVGTVEGLESRLVPARGFELVTIPRLPFPRRPSRSALSFPKRFSAAVRDLQHLIRRRGVDVVVGFGGYASAPGYLAAKREGVPVVVHEANARPGLANRMAARRTPYVGVAFSSTPLANAHLVGMPLRREIEELNQSAAREQGLKHFGLNPDVPTLLVTGGSQGARSLNLAVSSTGSQLTEIGWQVLHIWGERTEVTAPSIPNYVILTYCDRMDLALAVADLAISRAGSATVSELSGLGIPSILVPYPHGNGEQRLNAHDVVTAGGAILVEDAQFAPGWITHNLLPLMRNREALREMGLRARSAGSLDGTEKLLALIREARDERATVRD